MLRKIFNLLCLASITAIIRPCPTIAQSAEWIISGKYAGLHYNGFEYAGNGISYVLLEGHLLGAFGNDSLNCESSTTRLYRIADSTIEWTLDFIGDGSYPIDVDITDLATDESDNLYVAGIAESDSIKIGAFKQDLPDTCSTGFVVKISPEGSVAYFKTFQIYSGYPSSICVSKPGEVFLCGSYKRYLKWGQDTLKSDTLTSGGSSSYENNFFIARLDVSGDIQYLNRLEQSSSASSSPNQIDLDKNDEYLYLSGDFYEKVKYNGETILSSEDEGLFIIRLKADGNLDWAKEIAVDADYAYPSYSSVDSLGNIYFSGSTSGQIDVDGLQFYQKGDELNGFLLKCDTLGVAQWVITFGSDIEGGIGYEACFSQNFVYWTFIYGDGTEIGDTVLNTISNDPSVRNGAIAQISYEGTMQEIVSINSIEQCGSRQIASETNEKVITYGTGYLNLYIDGTFVDTIQTFDQIPFLTSIQFSSISADTSDSTVSVERQIPDNKMIAYPNPVNDNDLQVNNLQGSGSIVLRSVDGTSISTWRYSSEYKSLDLSHVSSGIYYLEVQGEKTNVLKIVVL